VLVKPGLGYALARAGLVPVPPTPLPLTVDGYVLGIAGLELELTVADEEEAAERGGGG